MKKINAFIFILFISVLLIGVYGFTHDTQAKESEVIILQTIEPIGIPGQLLITSSDGTQQEFPLGEFNSKNHASNALVLAQKLKEQEKNGYQIEEFSSAAAGNETSFVLSKTFVLRKK